MPCRLRKVTLFLIVALVLAAVLACGGTTPSPTMEQTESATEDEVTSTVEPSLVSPASLLGIDEPVVVENIQVQALGASTQDSVPMGDGEMYPDNPSDTFFEVQVAIEGEELVDDEAVFDWAGSNIRLVYDDEKYEMIAVGVEYDQGFFVGYIFTFTVPKDSQFVRYTLQVADDVTIDLSSFFE
jgi:hypothetical protein